MIALHWISGPEYGRRPKAAKWSVGYEARGKDLLLRKKLSMRVQRLLLRGLALAICLTFGMKSVASWQKGEMASWNSAFDESLLGWVKYGNSFYEDPRNQMAYWFPPPPPFCNMSDLHRYQNQGKIMDRWRGLPDRDKVQSGLIPFIHHEISVPMLAHVVQEITQLCYQLDVRLSQSNSGRLQSPPPPRSVPRNEHELAERISQLQLCVSRIRNVSTPSIGDPKLLPWRDRFQPLHAFAEHYEPVGPLQPGYQREAMNGAMQHSETGEWLNFAEAGNGAKVFAANPETKKPRRAIDGKMDSFLFNECSVKGGMWLVIELSHIARVKVIRLTMRELYSSRIKDFSAFGQLVAPAKDSVDSPASFRTGQWESIGNFTAGNRRGTQEFPVHHNAWVKFLGLHFESYHGMEKACTINEVGIFGVAPEQDREAFDVVDSDVTAQPDTTSPQVVDSKISIELNPVESPLQLSTGNELQTNTVGSMELPDSTIAQAKDLLSGGSVEGSRQHKETTVVVDQSEKVRLATKRVKDDGLVIVPVPGGDVEGGSEMVQNSGFESAGQTVDSASTSKEPPAVAAYKRIRQDVQTLKRNNSMLANYVDTLRGGLMDTIDELWEAIARMENRTLKVEAKILEVGSAVESIEKRLDRLEALAAYRFRTQVKLAVGIGGLFFGVGGVLLLKSEWFRGNFTRALITIFAMANFVTGILNVISLAVPVLESALFHHLPSWVWSGQV
ncbi:hypothetical protein BSKO_08805 [Bryopsis sp. KO-2023]|nr:hypothetical protein BSKO_08805 [Bryopsis sp. KO-2023]